jgi:hypothetical protein
MESQNGRNEVILAIRKRLTYSNVAVTLALVFAMSGGAYAAGKYLITSTKQIKPSVLKQLRGNTGPAGKEGLVGKEGPAGKEGLKGANGSNGTNGEKGAPGANGKSVVAGAEPKGANCANGGSNFEVEGSATKHYACNGETGFTETLPAGKTETGEWSLTMVAKGAEELSFAVVSFNIPLKAVPAHHYINTKGKEPFYNETTEKLEEQTQPECPGSVAEPKANSGNLCLYASAEENSRKQFPTTTPTPFVCSFESVTPPPGVPGCLFGPASAREVDKVGFGLVTVSEAAGFVNMVGTWAVTAK